MKLLSFLSISAIIAFSLYFFSNDLFYDQNGPWTDLWSKKTKTPISSVESIEQKFASKNHKFAKITIPIIARKKTALELSIYDKDGIGVRAQKIDINKNQQSIGWKFDALDGANNAYAIKISIPKNSKNNLLFFLARSYNPDEQILIDGKPIADKTLAYITEAKFNNTQEKIKALHERAKLYKPKFIQNALIPLFIIYLVIFPLVLSHTIGIVISKDKEKYDL